MSQNKLLSRRGFLKAGGAASLSLFISACARDPIPAPTGTPVPTNTSTAKPASTSTSIPVPTATLTLTCTDPTSLAPLPRIPGSRYSVPVPDTLDFQPAAELALAAMTNCTNPKDNYAPYDNMHIWRNPPVLFSTTMINGKYIEAATLLRFMTGSETNTHVDQSWRSIFLQGINDYPWWGIDGGRMLAWLGNNYRIEQDPCWLELSRKVAASVASRMVFKDNYGYMPDKRGQMPTGWEATWAGWLLQGFAVLFSATQDESILDLARKIAFYLKDRAGVFDADAHFLARHDSENGPALHFHHNGNALEGMGAFALAANDPEFATFATSGYEWARLSGSPLVGFFPEYIQDWPDDRPYIDCETCCTADMIQLAMNLSLAQQGDYWDDADRYLRNQFTEMQLRDTRWIDQMASALPPTPIAPNEDGERATERLLGSFASWASPNDWYIEGQPGTTFCCIGNGARTLYYAWEKMIAFHNSTLTLHLLFNRASSWADINSYLPFQGQVDVTMKSACSLEVRIPEWVTPGDVTATVNGNPAGLAFRGRYTQVGRLNRGDIVQVRFPLSERVENAVIGGKSYILIIKGNDVVAIDPPGKWYPFYQRSAYRGSEVQWITRDRFVPA